MFRIRRIHDDTLLQDKNIILQVQEILRSQFSLVSEKDILELPAQLKNPVKYRFRSILFVADDEKNRVKGFAFLFHVPDLDFCYLDFISAAKYKTGSGIGSILYERVREEARLLKSVGLFFECSPDDPLLCKGPDTLKQNKAGETPVPVGRLIPDGSKIYLVVNDKHALHNVNEKGYIESPVRISSIYKYLEKNMLFLKGVPKNYPDTCLVTVHDPEYVNYFKKICDVLKPQELIYPYVFPIRNSAKPPKELPVLFGFCARKRRRKRLWI